MVTRGAELQRTDLPIRVWKLISKATTAISEVLDCVEIDAPTPVVTRLMPPHLRYLQFDQTVSQPTLQQAMCNVPHGPSSRVGTARSCGWDLWLTFTMKLLEAWGLEGQCVRPSVLTFCFGLEGSVNLWSQELLVL